VRLLLGAPSNLATNNPNSLLTLCKFANYIKELANIIDTRPFGQDVGIDHAKSSKEQ
jgi:hypothetical protein